MSGTTDDDDAEQLVDAGFWGRLLHRWFVEYNPFYVVSAGCVLMGTHLISRGLSLKGSLFGQLAVAAIAETYAWALIAAAAWLTRAGSRRPAVMLALLVGVYQCDPTLHTETCAYLGAAGMVAGALWLASFVGKLHALAWALRLRVSRSAIGVPTLGAIGLALLPRVMTGLEPGSSTAVVGTWLFALLSAGLWTKRDVKSAIALDAWAATVLRRALNATWLIWTALVMSHVYFWVGEYGLNAQAFVPIGLLVTTRFMRRERSVWCAVMATLVLAALSLPSSFSLTAALAAAVLLLRAFRRPVVTAAPPWQAAPTPYRTADAPEPERPELSSAARPRSFVRASPPAIARLVTGALLGVYLSAWTSGWSGGAWPAHVIWLDLLLGGMLLVAILKARVRAACVPLAMTYCHLAVRMGLLTAPQTQLEWGMAWVGVGFCLLIVSLIVTSRVLRSRQAPS